METSFKNICIIRVRFIPCAPCDRSEGERDEWLAAVQSAIDANIERRSTFLAASTAAYVKPNIDELGKQVLAYDI